MAQIRWSENGERWLENVYRHISRTNPQAADRVVDSIMERITWLSDHPLLGYRLEHDCDKHIRVLIHGHYRIIYSVDQPNETVIILGVIHTAMDLDAHFDPDAT